MLDTTFTYTDIAFPDSSVVEGLAYNKDSKELLVNLNGTVYRYDNVPPYQFSSLRDAPSVGAYFQSTTKPFYGPATNLGYVNDVELVEAVKPRETVGTPKDLTYAKDAVVTEDKKFDLKVVPPVAVEPNEGVQSYEYDVVFTVGDDDTERTYSVQADDVDGAIDALTEVGQMLGLDFEVLRVVVEF